MSWLRIDDGFTEHRKIVGLKRSERWTWLEVLTYCARQGNGTIPDGISSVIRYVTPPFLTRCVELGLIDKTDQGMVVHDWDLYNPKDPLKAERQARWRRHKAQGHASTPPSTETSGVDESGVYKNVYGDGAPSPTPTPSPNGSTVSSTQTHPVVPDEAGVENREVPMPELREIPW